MKSLAVLLAGAALSIGASAATVTVSHSYDSGFKRTELVTETGSLGLFDSTLGTLLSVQLSFDGAVRSDYSITNNNATRGFGRATGFSDLSFELSNPTLNALIVNPLVSVEYDTNRIFLDPGQTTGVQVVSSSDSVAWDSTGVLSGLLSQFIGTGTLDLTCNTDSGLGAQSSGGNVVITQNTFARCGATVTYTYEETPRQQVPEPATLALVGLALAGLSLSRKGRKA